DPILFPKVVDEEQLAVVHPPGHCDQDEPERVQEADHRKLHYRRPGLQVHRSPLESGTSSFRTLRGQFHGSVANSSRAEVSACVLVGIYAERPKIVWMNWRCATASSLATQRT